MKKHTTTKKIEAVCIWCKVVDSTYEDRRGGEKIAVPEINFKRFKETKNVIVFTSRQEFKRSGWV